MASSSRLDGHWNNPLFRPCAHCTTQFALLKLISKVHQGCTHQYTDVCYSLHSFLRLSVTCILIFMFSLWICCLFKMVSFCIQRAKGTRVRFLICMHKLCQIKMTLNLNRLWSWQLKTYITASLIKRPESPWCSCPWWVDGNFWPEL